MTRLARPAIALAALLTLSACGGMGGTLLQDAINAGAPSAQVGIIAPL